MLRTALRFILFDKPKSFGALMGTVMSVFLIGQQSGVFLFLINSMSALPRNNSEYIWVIDDQSTNVNALGQINIRIGNELQSIEGVDNVYPLITTGIAAKFKNGKSANLTLVGVQVPSYVGGPWNMNLGQKSDMLRDGAIVTDFFDKNALGGLMLGDYFEVNGKQVVDAAQTKGIRAFGGVYAFTTLERARYLSNISTDKASAFLVKLRDNSQELSVINRINSQFSGVHAWKADELASQTIITVLKTSGIAISFGTIIVFALIIGFVIIGLTLYSSVIDRLKDYGTLKAIGATNSFIRRLILTQAFIIGVVGYFVGALITEGFRKGISNTGVIFSFPIWMRLALFVITIVIALCGSLFAIRRITKLEPGQVFRG